MRWSKRELEFRILVNLFGDVNLIIPSIRLTDFRPLCSFFVAFLSLELANKIEFVFVGLKNCVRTAAEDVFDAFYMTLVFAYWFIGVRKVILIFLFVVL